MKKIIIMILMTIVSSMTFAQQTVGSIADNIIDQITDVPTMMASVSYVFGVLLGIKSLLKFKEYNESKGQVKLIIPIMMFVSSALMLGLPSTLKIGVTALSLDKAGQTKNDISKF
jgi:predicted membrane channel-forming protein YqfA (hemolysin III family)